MNKNFMLSVLAMLILTSTSAISYANDDASKMHVKEPVIKEKVGEYKHSKHFKDMEAKKIEFEKRLKLTEDQKKKIEENKLKDREKIKPIFDDMHAKKSKIREIMSNKDLSYNEKLKKTAPLEKDLIDLRVKADDLRKKNMENFEKILTPEQKVEFEKIKAEQREEMKKHRRHFKGHFAHPPIERPVMPEPIPVEK